MDEEKKERKLTKMESEVQAIYMKMVNGPIAWLDLEYLKAAARGLKEQASFQQTAAIFNPNHISENDDVLVLQSRALNLLVEYAECLKEITKKKAVILSKKETQNNISKLFMDFE